jgi:DNA-binding LacI/PurR family transcriptional regulator
MPVTIKDIARAAGVSHTTVSRALHDYPALAPATVKKIKSLAESMGYIPSAAARGLKTRRTNTLGVILSNIDDPYFSEILQGIEDELRETGYSLLLAATHRNPKIEEGIVRVMGEQRVDGVIVGSTQFNTQHSRMLQQIGVPVAVINNQAAEVYRYSIYHDDEFGSRSVTQHLLDLGHTRIGFLGNSLSGKTNEDRVLGYKNAMDEAELPILPEWIHCEPAAIPDAGVSGGKYFLSLKEKPTAIVCFNDLMAIGLMHSIQEAGYQIPEDFSVTGFDDITFSNFTRPALTTFHQPKKEIGAAAARMLMEMVHQPDDGSSRQPRIVVLRGSLLVRGSTASPKTN